jgi:uncharacterized protein (TIGR02266 family)
MAQASVSSDGQRALAELAPKLTAVPERDLVRPGTDPHSAAVTGMLVADFLCQPDLEPRLAGAGVTKAEAQELGRLARAIFFVVEKLGGDYLPDSKGVPGDLVQRGSAIRAKITSALDASLPDRPDASLATGSLADPELRSWLDAVRLGSGVVDLVYDLRTLADVCATHAAAAAAVAGAPADARSAADALEYALRSGESAEEAKHRNLLVRLWTVFVPAYGRAQRAGRELSRALGKSREHDFPPLALIASHRRARRRPVSLVPARPSVPARGVAPVVAGDLGKVEVLHATDIVSSEAPQQAERPSFSELRKEQRQVVEIEVGISSQSNFYLGFTENLSSGGVFVATYARKPIGSRVEIALAFPTGEELRVPGVVRWQREASADGWPGMGVQFEALSPEDEAKIRKFLSVREPLFYDD